VVAVGYTKHMCAAAASSSIVATLFIIIVFFFSPLKNGMHTKPPRRRHVVGRGRKRCRRRRRRRRCRRLRRPVLRRCRHRYNTIYVYIYIYIYIYHAYLRKHTTHTLACRTVRPIFILYIMCVKIINDGKNSIELALRFVVRTRSNQLHPPPPVHLLSRSCIALLFPSPMGR